MAFPFPFIVIRSFCLFRQMIGKCHQEQNEPGVIPGQPAGLNPESRDSGFDASHRPGMTL
jgi:hypothetical protein